MSDDSIIYNQNIFCIYAPFLFLLRFSDHLSGPLVVI